MPSTHGCTITSTLTSLTAPRARLHLKTTTISAPYNRPLGFKDRVSHPWRRAALEVDFTDPDVLLAIAGGVVGLAVGVGFPVFMVSRDEADEERVEALRELNRETFEATGEYMSKEELAKIRPPRWTDRREFKDDD